MACILAVMITDESSLAEIAASASGARGKKTSPQRSPVSTPQRTKWRNVSLEVLGSDRSLNLGNIPVFPGGPSVGDRAMDTPVPESQDSAFSFGAPVAGSQDDALAQQAQNMDISAGSSSSAALIVGDAPGVSKLLCPVIGCPCADASRDPGWNSDDSLRRHVDLHLVGELPGKPPVQWLQDRNLTACLVCGFSASRRIHGGIHSSCWPRSF